MSKLFPDEEPAQVLPKKPKINPPLNKHEKIWGKIGSLAIAAGLWTAVKLNIDDDRIIQTGQVQDVATKQGRPLIIQEPSANISEKVTEILSWEKSKSVQTTIINPLGQEPPITIVTPTETITAGADGKARDIIPHNANNKDKTSTPAEAQWIVDKAVQGAIEKNIPKEEPATTLIPQKN